MMPYANPRDMSPPVPLVSPDLGANAVGSPEDARRKLLGRRTDTPFPAKSDIFVVGFPEIRFESSTSTQPAEVFSFVQSGHVQTSLGALEYGVFDYTLANDTVVPRVVDLIQVYDLSRIGRLFAAAREERFEDGMYSKFGRALEAVLVSCGAPAVLETELLIHNPRTAPTVAAEALRTLGSLKSNLLAVSRRRVIEAGLTHRSELVRDAAAVALASLGDRLAIPSLVAACKAESMAGLKADMQQVIDELSKC